MDRKIQGTPSSASKDTPREKNWELVGESAEDCDIGRARRLAATPWSKKISKFTSDVAEGPKNWDMEVRKSRTCCVAGAGREWKILVFGSKNQTQISEK